jgi:aminoglycoside 3-N-acetyltransferase
MAAMGRTAIGGQLRELGVAEGGLVMVHAGLRSLGPITGGAETVVRALLDAVGGAGTLCAYVDFEPFYEEGDPEIPEFDKRTARAARAHGALNETLRTWPGARRSDHPDAGVVGIGPRAEWLVAPHPFQYGYGEGSPFERIVEAGGQVLMLGAPLDTITLLHHAEHKARIGGKRIVRYRRLMTGGQWAEFEEFDTARPIHEALPEDVFERIARDYLAGGRGAQAPLGAGTAYLFDAPGLVQFAVEWIERQVGRAYSG